MHRGDEDGRTEGANGNNERTLAGITGGQHLTLIAFLLPPNPRLPPLNPLSLNLAHLLPPPSVHRCWVRHWRRPSRTRRTRRLRLLYLHLHLHLSLEQELRQSRACHRRSSRKTRGRDTSPKASASMAPGRSLYVLQFDTMLAQVHRHHPSPLPRRNHDRFFLLHDA